MRTPLPTVAVLGASGLIGQTVGEELERLGFDVVALARRFMAAQMGLFRRAVTAPLVELDAEALRALLVDSGARVVVNCLGVLQDGPGSSTRDVHEVFVARLLSVLGSLPEPPLLVHLSMPGDAAEDRTAFASTKRAAEEAIAASGLHHVVLRPGFVVAPAAFGGSALMRALAMLPVGLPAELDERPFTATAVSDIAATIAFAAREWAAGRELRAVWDVCEREPRTVGGVLATFRERLGGPSPRLRLPGFLLSLGARAGDVAAWLGWAPPIRSTALAEMRRGVAADPTRWMRETGLEPAPLAVAMKAVAVSVQERWFARLYLAKALVVATLAVFWLVSGTIALTVAFEPASAILSAHGFPPGAARALTVATSLLDIAIGLAIAHRSTCRLGLLAGMLVSVGYLAGAAVLAPALWLDPLGALVKTIPAIVLMLVALLLLEAR